MELKTIILGYALTFAVFIVVDLIWLGFIAKSLYAKYLGSFLTENVNWTAAIIFYLIFVAGIILFVVYPSVEKDSFLNALVMGAIFGIVTYATYDLTNLATLKGWPLEIVIIDIFWGAVLSTIVSGSGFYIFKYLNQ